MAEETTAQASAFALAAQQDFTAQVREVYLEELDLTVRCRLASVEACRQAIARSPKGDDLKVSAYLVRDNVELPDGSPIVSRDQAGLDFLMRQVRPSVLGKLAKVVGGQTLDELGNG